MENEKIRILNRIYGIITTEEDLWLQVSKLMTGPEYSGSNFCGRMLKLLDFLQTMVGPSEEIASLKSEIISMSHDVSLGELSFHAHP